MNKYPMTRNPWSVTGRVFRQITNHKSLITTLCLLASLGSPITAHAVSLLAVSNDGGVSNRTSSSAYLSGFIGITNNLGGVLTNLFYDGPTDGGTIATSWSRVTTNTAHQGTGLVQTNLPFASGVNRYYLFSVLD